MSLPVLIAQTECKSSANSLHLYELLFLVSYPDPNVRKHYRLQYNTAYIGSGQQVEEVVLGM